MADAALLNLGMVLAILTLGASLMLLFVSVLSYMRLRQAKLLLAGGAFLLLAVKGGLSTWQGYATREMDLLAVGLDAGVLAFLYASVAKR